MMRLIQVLGAPALLATMLTCGGGWAAGTSRGEGIEAFPPMPSDHPPGASIASQTTSTALGRGVNFGDMLDAPNEGDWGLRLRDEFIDVTVQAGFTSVRLPVRWSNHAAATAPFTLAPAFLSRVESVFDKLLAKGVYVVVDMHHYRQLDGDELDSGESAVDSALLDVRFLMIWQQIAERFRGKSNHLLFELYNEPHGRLTPPKWNDLAARALNVVRKSNPSRIVVIGPTNWNAADALSSLRLPNDANLIVTIHNYEPFDFTHQGADWVQPVPPTGVHCCNADQQAAAIAPLVIAKAWSDSVHYPIFLGEFGAYEKADMPSRVQFTRLVRDAAEARGIRWTYWELAANFGVYDPLAHMWRAPLKNALLGN
jgi:endoglucanase